MECIQNLLEQNDYSLSSSDESDSEIESLSIINLRKHNNDEIANNQKFNIKSQNSITSKKRNGEKRLPTRKPDPNVYNRNALLARENRRKKKVYLETIEKELVATRKANRSLVKALKRQFKVAQRLEKEKKYFEGLISNKSKILKLVKALNFRHISEPETDMSPISSTNSNVDFTNNDIGGGVSTISLSNSLNDAEILSMQLDSPSDDFETDSSLPSSSSTWDSIWGHNGYHIDNLILPETTLKQNKNELQSVNDDHCYVTTSTTSVLRIKTPDLSQSSEYIDVEGDCSHIGVLCPINNWNSASCTPPLQLLSDQ